MDGDEILATASMALNGNCAGVAYAYRIDTNDALAFISEFVQAESVLGRH